MVIVRVLIKSNHSLIWVDANIALESNVLRCITKHLHNADGLAI